MTTPGTTRSTATPIAGAAPDLRRFWRVLLAVVAPVPPLAIAASTLVAPYPMDGEFTDVLSGVAASPGRMQAGLWFGLLALLTLVPATAALAWVCRRRSPRLTTVAALVAVPGLTAATVLPNDELTALAASTRRMDNGTLLALNEAVWNQPTTLAVLALFLIGMVLGGILLGVALWRSRIAPRALPVALVVGSVLHLAPAFAGNAVSALSWLLTAVGYSAATLALLRMSDDEFDLPPETRAG